MTVIGLTGKTGSGKSIICAELEKRGAFIIDTDKIAREIVEIGSPALKELCAFFGDDILNADKSLNRKVLAKKAFSSKESTSKLNEITHPYIEKKVLEKLEFAKKNSYDISVIDAAALLESDCKNFCNIIAVVTANEETRLRRIIERDSLKEDEALSRIKAQKSDEYYQSNADIIIMNDDGCEIEKSAKRLIDFVKNQI